MATLHRLPDPQGQVPPTGGGLRAAVAIRLGAMAALLRQGRKVFAVSIGLLGLAALWLLLDTLFMVQALSWPGMVLAGLSLVIGVIQLRLAMRVDFDAGLVDGLAGYAHLLPDDSATRRVSADAELGALLDRSLEALDLRDLARPGEDWATRWRGMRRLLRLQFACVGLQATLLGCAWALSVLHLARG
ncbi:MAG: hypothetical protein ACREO3_00150 [Arenimonas sp.]